VNAPRVLRVSAIVLAALALAAAAGFYLGASMGLFSGKRPTDLGFRDGAFKAGDWKPNWVSSTAPKDDAKHYIAPFAIRGERAKAWAALDAAISATPRATIVRRDPGYIHAEFATKAGFVDDAEFAMAPDGSAIHVRSGARLGIRDFGVNRDRIEALRARVAAP
jgi:uncharacterized protein (DUF1499 family)